MLRPIVGCLSILLCGLATPSFAGNVYIPVLGGEVDGVSYETQVTLSNPEMEDGEFTTYFIPIDTDGTERGDDDGQSALLLARRTVVSTYGSEYLGMLEIETDPNLVFDARLTGTGDEGARLGTQVPVVTASNVIAADTAAFLQGWLRAGDRVTDFGIMNLGAEEAECWVNVFNSQGVPFIPGGTTLPWKPLSLGHISNAVGVLESLGLASDANFSDLRATVRCSERFYPYAVIRNSDTGEVSFVTPSAVGNAGLIPQVPDDPDDPPQGCSNGTVCFEDQGTFHTPRPAFPVLRKVMTPPVGQYRWLRAQLDVTHGGWANGNASGTHNIFWLVRDRNVDMFGYVNVRGPGRDDIFIRHGFNLSQGDKPRISRNAVFVPGQTYHFDYLYDTGNRRIELVVTDQSGNEVVRMQGTPNINRINFDQGQQILMDFGFPPGLNPNEPPTYGWNYSNLKIELMPQ